MSLTPAIAFHERFLAILPAFLRPHWDRVRASPLGYRLAKGAFWSIVGAVLSRGLGLVSSILVARMLGKESFGELGMIQSTVGMFGVFAGFGLGLTATKYIAEFRQKDHARAARILALSAVVSWGTGILATTALIMLAPRLAITTLAAPHLTGDLRVGALLILFGAVNGAQTGALSGFEAFKRIAQVNFFAGLVHFPCLTLGCWLYGLPGTIWGLAAAAAIGCVINRWALWHEARQEGIPIWSPKWFLELHVLWKFSLPTVLASFLVSPLLWFGQALLVRSPGGYKGMAEYSVGLQWANFVQYIPGLLSVAYLPIAASVYHQNTHRKRKLLSSTCGVTAGVSASAAVAIFAASPLVLGAYGSAFLAAKWILGLMLFVGVVQSVNTVLLQTILAAGKPWLRLISNVFWAFLYALGSITLVPRYGALGLALAAVLAQVGHICLQISLTLHMLKRS